VRICNDCVVLCVKNCGELRQLLDGARVVGSVLGSGEMRLCRRLLQIRDGCSISKEIPPQGRDSLVMKMRNELAILCEGHYTTFVLK
jgi:hypothetical protein